MFVAFVVANHLLLGRVYLVFNNQTPKLNKAVQLCCYSLLLSISFLSLLYSGVIYILLQVGFLVIRVVGVDHFLGVIVSKPNGSEQNGTSYDIKQWTQRRSAPTQRV
jgi:hypothetical protein